jgi:D-alanyl-lipoteichoic acid acyltransferase DltB (MBOAT superfamily)
MLFNSFSFLLFFLCVLTVHSLPLPWRFRKLNLLVASFVFYAAWDVRFPLLLVYATATNWLAGRLIARWEQFSRHRRIVLWLDVALNIGLMCAFKYGGEFLDAWNWFARQFSPSYESRTIKVLLPVGLSFFTFQSLSYTIDVYRRQIKPASSLLNLALFVSFFPVLFSGPLLRAGDFLPQCEEPRRMTRDQVGMGAAFIALGLFMKITLADHLLLPIVRQAFDPRVHPDTLTAWIGTIAFAGQDYCDFAGYTTCAVGIGLCLGFALPDNFRAPFASVGFRDLWQRWHITLVAWMRDYVFLSLGGVYKGYRRAAINVMIVFLLIGLWHGAAMTYVIFGLLQGAFLIAETIVQRSPVRRLPLWNGSIGTFLMWLATMLLCCVAFVFYRSETLEQSWTVLSAMAGVVHTSHPFELADFDVLITALIIEFLVIAHWLRRGLSLAEVVARVPWWVTSICLALMLLAIMSSSGESQSFLYFHY